MVTQKAALNQYRRNCKKAGNNIDEKLILELAPVIKKMSIHIKNRIYSDFSAEDLSSIAMVALVDAAAKIDTENHEEARHYLLKRARGAVYDELRKNDTMTRASRDFYRDYQNTYDKLRMSLSREPQGCEVAQELDMDKDEMYEELRKTQSANFYSLENWFSGENNEDDEYNSKIPGTDDDGGENMSDLDLQTEIISAMDKLKFQERLMLSLYYYDSLNFKEIAQVLKISVGRVSQIHTSAIARLKNIVSRTN